MAALKDWTNWMLLITVIHQNMNERVVLSSRCIFAHLRQPLPRRCIWSVIHSGFSVPSAFLYLDIVRCLAPICLGLDIKRCEARCSTWASSFNFACLASHLNARWVRTIVGSIVQYRAELWTLSTHVMVCACGAQLVGIVRQTLAKTTCCD